MEKFIAHKIKMHDKADYVLQKYEYVWESNIVFKENVILFRKYKGLVYEKINLQLKPKSTSARKKMVHDEMIDFALLVCNLGIVHSSSKKDEELMVKFDYSLSDLRKGIEDDVWDRCEKISQSALPILDKLIELGLPADHLTKLNTVIAEYKILVSLPESIINASKSAKEDMLKFIASGDDVLKTRLDKMILLFKDSHPEFYNEFFNARYIGGWSRKDNGDVEGSEEEPVV